MSFSPPLHEASLLTIADWRGAVRAGADLPALLRARLARLTAGASAHAWIALADEARLEARLAKLQALAAGRSVDDLLRAHPLFGVPFAVKDN
ncbi:MAG: allophanate hydrolase, partial [Rubrivivax sp.]|nr:allophanate hydrolase [Rubrivivax sp.]